MSRRFIIPDIHGCLRTLEALFTQIAVTKTDRLYFLGDFVDKGPDSAGVLDLLIRMEKTGFRIFKLRGNHEHNILVTEKEYNPRMFVKLLKLNKSRELLGPDDKLLDKYRAFMQNTSIRIELPDLHLVHAGFDFRDPDPFGNRLKMMTMRGFDFYDPEQAGYKRIIHGHQPTDLEKIKQKIRDSAPILPLDNGVYVQGPRRYVEYRNLGNLLAFNPDTSELFVQKYCEKSGA